MGERGERREGGGDWGVLGCCNDIPTNISLCMRCVMPEVCDVIVIQHTDLIDVK